MATFRIDRQRSHLWIEARSSLHAIHSETSGLEGWFEGEFLDGGRLNPAVAPQAHLELSVQLLSSGNPLNDREMRRRIDARRYPTITGELTSMKESEPEGRYLVGGGVTFRGVTRRYTDNMTLSWPDDRTLVLEGEREFDIRDFGMEPPRILTLRVYPEVKIRVAIVAVQEAS